MRTTLWVIGVAAIAAAIGASAYAVHGWTLDGALAAARWTARWSFPWFLLAWSASSLALLWPGGWRRTLLRRRRAVGLSFAAAHIVHAGFFLTAIFQFDLTRPLPLFLGGGTAYTFIILMALTSNDAAVRALGARHWKRLHTVGGWVVMAVFVKSYFGRLVEAPVVGALGSALIVAAFALRYAAWRRRKADAAAVMADPRATA
jgi:DMSO/TMAO reductase YedYZ heme-binding membrane subunit